MVLEGVVAPDEPLVLSVVVLFVVVLFVVVESLPPQPVSIKAPVTTNAETNTLKLIFFIMSILFVEIKKGGRRKSPRLLF